MPPFVFHFVPFLFPAIFAALIYYYFNNIRNRAREVLSRIQKDIQYSYLNQKVWFMKFDVTSKKNKFQINPYKTLYTFYKADIYILSNQIVIFGKGSYFGKEISLIPFSIYFGQTPDIKSFMAFYTQFVSASVVNSNLEIEFIDADYPKTIKLFVKSLGEEILSKIPS